MDKLLRFSIIALVVLNFNSFDVYASRVITMLFEKNQLTFVADHDRYHIEIIDSTGQNQLTNIVESSKFTLNIKFLPKGKYLVKLTPSLTRGSHFKVFEKR